MTGWSLICESEYEEPTITKATHIYALKNRALCHGGYETISLYCRLSIFISGVTEKNK